MTITNSIQKILQDSHLSNSKKIRQAVEHLVPSKDRRIKIHPHFTTTKSGTKTKPKIILCGNWLAKAGFTEDQYISVTVKKGTLLITNEN